MDLALLYAVENRALIQAVKGVAMFSSVLRSKRAILVNINCGACAVCHFL